MNRQAFRRAFFVEVNDYISPNNFGSIDLLQCGTQYDDDTAETCTAYDVC